MGGEKAVRGGAPGMGLRLHRTGSWAGIAMGTQVMEYEDQAELRRESCPSRSLPTGWVEKGLPA